MTDADDKRPPIDKEAGGSISVEMTGVVQTGIMAIGAETTGTTITAMGFTWELDLRANEELVELAEKSNGKQVVVTGSLKIVDGVERGRRVIVMVKTLKPSKQ